MRGWSLTRNDRGQRQQNTITGTSSCRQPCAGCAHLDARRLKCLPKIMMLCLVSFDLLHVCMFPSILFDTARSISFFVVLAPWLLLLVYPPQAAAGDPCTHTGNGAVAVACGIVAVFVAGWAQLLDAHVLWPSSAVKAYVKV